MCSRRSKSTTSEEPPGARRSAAHRRCDSPGKGGFVVRLHHTDTDAVPAGSERVSARHHGQDECCPRAAQRIPRLPGRTTGHDGGRRGKVCVSGSLYSRSSCSRLKPGFTPLQKRDEAEGSAGGGEEEPCRRFLGALEEGPVDRGEHVRCIAIERARLVYRTRVSRLEGMRG